MTKASSGGLRSNLEEAFASEAPAKVPMEHWSLNSWVQERMAMEQMYVLPYSGKATSDLVRSSENDAGNPFRSFHMRQNVASESMEMIAI